MKIGLGIERKTMNKNQFLRAKNDTNCLGIIYRIPWGKLVKEDKKNLSNLLVSPGYSKMNIVTHKSINGILDKYSES